ncbi:MAG: hypothetical protein ABFS28_01775 [Bacteroidota bacterium]
MDPEAYYKDTGSEYILRRGYNHMIDDSDYTPSTHFIPFDVYQNRFQQIYNSLTSFQGEDLYRELSNLLDLDYIIAKDPVLYSYYLEAISALFQELSREDIAR